MTKKKTKKKTKRVVPTKTKKKKAAATRSAKKKGLGYKQTVLKLTDQHKGFCKEYIIHFDGQKAVMAVSKCSGPSAAVIANRWLDDPIIRKYLMKITKKREERLNAKADDAMVECMRIAYMDAALAFEEDGCTLRNIHDIPIELRRTISGFEVSEIKENGKQIGLIKKVKFCSKDKNLEMLFKHHGLFEKDHEQAEKRGTLLIIKRPSKK